MHIQHQLACLAFIASNYWASVSAGYVSLGSLSADAEDNSFGHLSGGEVVSGLHNFNTAHNLEVDADAHDSLGSLGDHLNEHNFPADIESGLYKGDDSGIAGIDYGGHLAASEYHGQGESLGIERKDVHYNDIDLGGQHYGHGRADLLYGELEHKAVRGIDHGKGAFSYSTLYESKDEK